MLDQTVRGGLGPPRDDRGRVVVGRDHAQERAVGDLDDEYAVPIALVEDRTRVVRAVEPGQPAPRRTIQPTSTD